MINNYVIPIPKLDFTSEGFILISQIGILFLLFISGLETGFSKLKKMEKASSFVAIGGVIFPLIIGFIAAMILGFNSQESIAIALILIATSVGVTVRTLMDLHQLNTDVGATILGSAVIDDIIAVSYTHLTLPTN